MLSQASAINMQNNRAIEQRLMINKRIVTPNSRYKYYIDGRMAPSAMPNNGPYKYLMNGSHAPPPSQRRKKMPTKSMMPTLPPPSAAPPLPTVRALSMRPAASLVSVIMVLNNNLDTFRQSVYTILKQTHQNIELIIIDNNSTDGTLEFIKKLTDTRIKTYALKENTTIANCYNLGMQMSKGDFITFQNPTYVSTPERLAKQIATITDNSSSVVGESVNDNLDKVNCNYESLMINRNQFNKFGFFRNIDEYILEYAKRLIKNKIQISNLSELYYLRYDPSYSDCLSKNLEAFSDSDVSTDIKVPFTDLSKFNI